jgi:hypothetical protein
MLWVPRRPTCEAKSAGERLARGRQLAQRGPPSALGTSRLHILIEPKVFGYEAFC